ncbi:MAG: hypothetical protein D3906_07130 [Candidatus Electrothrix sp. AUS1_2]|nr:hypothetical protein [Candidatus Electrothrix sp. AUS1_2]
MNPSPRTCYILATKYIVSIIIMISVCCYIALQANIITDLNMVIGCIIGTIVGIVALILELQKKIIELDLKFDDFINKSSHQLLSLLYNCQIDFFDTFNSFKEDEGEVVVNHLGLDMYHAWARIRQFIDQGNHKCLNLKILMITYNYELLGQSIPQEVKNWCAISRKSLETIRMWAENPDNQCKIKSLTVKMYSVVPVCHGFAIEEPFQHRVAYFSFCRWDKNSHYTWGEECYWKVDAHMVDQVSNDMKNIFNGTFQHLWLSSGDPVLHWDSEC